ncbi:MAG: ABC transporter permease [Acidobacteriia bacterium]|nr:ABC transporter permease [Terriglobia bacterium]
MQNLWQDLRHSVRLIFRNPGFAALAVLVLALGIGANTAIFTLINNLILRPMPFEKPEQLVGCFSKDTQTPNTFREFSYPNYVDIRDSNGVFTDLTAHSVAIVGITEGDATRRVFSEIVAANYFTTLGVSLWKGGPFTPAEEKPGAAIPVVIVSYEYWRRAGQDPDFVGKSLWINGRAHTIIGIAREGFTGRTMVASSGVWLPLGMYETAVNDFEGVRRPLADRSNYSVFLVGRLKPGITNAQADSQLALLSAQLEKTYPQENAHQTIITHRLSRFSISTDPQDETELRGLSILLAALAALVLLIACFNLANMMLARGTSRRKEFAIRLALGCSRRRILAQLLTEGFLLSLLGAAVGLLFAVWATRLLVYSLNSISPITILLHTTPDIRVFAAMLGFCLFSTVIFSFGPALKAARPDVVGSLKECTGEEAGAGRGHRIFSSRNLLVVGQLALSLMLLTIAGLFVRGALKAGHVNPGYSLDNGVVVELDAGLVGYDEARGRQLYRRVEERLAALPGVESVSAAATVPFGMISLGRSVLKAEDAARTRAEDRNQVKTVSARFNIIGADYLHSLGVPLLRGRTFSAVEEEPGSKTPVALVDEALAKKLWPGEDPLGKRIAFQSEDMRKENPVMEVVGVVPTLTDSLLGVKNGPHVYVPFGQLYQSNINFHLRLLAPSPSAEASLMRDIRREIHLADEHLPILSLKTMRTQLDQSMDMWLFSTGARMFSLLGGLALFLAVVGVYGLKAYTVARRTREIGIRMALGATMQDTQWMVVKEGLWLTLIGAGLGLALALLTGRLLASLLYEVSPMDPVVLVAAPLLLTAVSLLASYIPARRAAQVDPMVALRYE